jgi:hypothetical protein
MGGDSRHYAVKYTYRSPRLARTLAHTYLGLCFCISAVACGGAEPRPPTIEPAHSWCPEAFEAGPGDTCFAIPSQHQHAKVLVYIPSSGTEATLMREYDDVKQLVTKGFAVILTRGRKAHCGFTESNKEGACWPTPEDAPAHKELALGWDKAIWQVSALLETQTPPRWIIGFRDGATLAAHVTKVGGLHIDGLGLIDMPTDAPLDAPSDAQSYPVAVSAEESEPGNLREAFNKGKWTYAVCTHPSAANASATAPASPSVGSLSDVVEALTDLGKAHGKRKEKDKDKKRPAGEEQASFGPLRSSRCSVRAP